MQKRAETFNNYSENQRNALNFSLELLMMKFFSGKNETPVSRPSGRESAVGSVPGSSTTPPISDESPKTSLFGRMKQAVSRTRETLSAKIETIVALTRTVDESTLEDLESALLTSDLGVQTTAVDP